MAKIHKIWEITTDLDIGSKAKEMVWVENDVYAYLLKFNFIRNRRSITSLEDIPGEPFIEFILPSGATVEYEIVDIVGDIAWFLIPNDLLTESGVVTVKIGWSNQGDKYVLNELFVNILPDPWEVI